jgi:Leucine-rich repeat (LRR) protein
LALSASYIAAVDFRCTFYGYDWNQWGDSYSCLAVDADLKEPDMELTLVDENHVKGSTNNDVKAFILAYKEKTYIPKGIKNFFPNFNELHIWSANLQKIDRHDFEDYKNLQTLNIIKNPTFQISSDSLDDLFDLKYLDLSSNKLTSLPNLKNLIKLKEFYCSGNELTSLSSDVFSKNGQLIKINFYNNKLISINRNAIQHLGKLQVAKFANNTCIDLNAPEQKTILELKNEIISKC